MNIKLVSIMPNFQNLVSSKLPDAATSIFAVMSKLAHEEKALNLSQGYPDFPTSPELINLVSEAMKQGFNQYAPMPGIYSLRDHYLRGRIPSQRYKPEGPH